MMRTLYIILFFIICVAVGAAGDALNYRKHGGWGHALCAIEVLMLLCGGWVVVYVCIRVAGFDYLYNLFAGLPWDFHGTTSIWDRFLGSHPEHGIAFSKTVFLMIGIGVAYYEL